jgi:C-terminal processing protease CtpA/Prc
MPLDRYVKELNTFLITKVKDPHFFIDCKLTNIKRPLSPIAVARINERYQVAAVFDDSLRSLLPTGSIILKVDDTKVGKHIPEIARLNQLIRKVPGEEVTLSFKTPNGKYQSLHYKIKDRYTIPSTFRPVNLALRPLNDTTIYYKINQVNTELTLDFVSKLDTINKRKKLILDFRGCGGGDVIAGAQFLSFFTDGPFKYFDFIPLDSERKDSVIVQGNTSPFRYRKDGRIIILADNNTACTAELIIYRLRQMKNYAVTFIGKENTKGALALLTEIMLPAKDVSIGTNAMITGKILLDGKSIENIGIRPDIYVQVNEVADLQPYNDLVLKTAIFN